MAPSVSVSPLSLLHFWLFLSARALEMIDGDAPELTCSEGLTYCSVSSDFQFAAFPPYPDDTTNIADVQLQVFLCCSAAQDCKPCVQVKITVQVAESGNTKEFSEVSGHRKNSEDIFITSQTVEGSGQFVASEPKASVKVCHSSPGSHEFCKILEFKPRNSGFDQSQHHTLKVLTYINYSCALKKEQRKSVTCSSCKPVKTSTSVCHELLLRKNMMFGSPVVVLAFSYLDGAESTQNTTIPSLDKVCSMDLEWAVKDCGVPRLRAVTDHKRKEVLLQLENNTNTSKDELMFHMVWNNISGEDLTWPKGKTEMAVPSNFVAPCLCFEVWWKGKELRTQFCPFKNKQDALERMQQNVSMSVVESWMRDGRPRLRWNVTAPCRLEGEVWLCKKDHAGSLCKEVLGSRQRLNDHEHAGWRASRKGHWKTGEFNTSSHPLLCIQLQIDGMKSYFEPHCPFARSRLRWSLPFLIPLLLICIAILGAYLIQGVLKGYMWRWLKEDDVKGAVGGGHVVLLYPSDDDQALPELMSHLGSSLQALGFSVSLDLWSQAELGVLGPVPWLHSRLNRLQRHGGKVVLVLTQTAWIRAVEWGARSWERNTPRSRDMKPEEEVEGNYAVSSQCVDVFTASLSCILADYLQGRAGERFMLVQFESLPPEPPGGFRPLPELFRGLHVYSLPSQSLGFLTELAGARKMATASARRKRAGGLRLASRALARGLSGFTAGTTVLRLAGVSQGCVGVEVEDSMETVPLKPCLITPPSSPDSSQKVSAMEWV